MLVPLLATVVMAQADSADPAPMLLRSPTTNGTTVVFQYAGDLWSVPISGGAANRLTNSPGVEGSPYFSPDGKTIAFTGQYEGNTDVFIMPAQGGVPKRLTAHPSPDVVQGWTPDGKNVLFYSGMLSNMPMPRLMTVSTGGGVPKALPLPTGQQGSYSPDGAQIAYVPGAKWQQAWKRYRGGQAYSIWIARLSDSKWTAIPKKNENNERPMWVGDKVYYLSDKNGVYGIFSYDVDSNKVDEVVKGEGFDVKAATAGPGVIVYEKLGSLNVLDLKTKQHHKIDVEVNGDFPEVRSEIKNLARYISSASIAPTGQRVVVTARGRVFTVPAQKGDARQLTEGDGIDRRDAAWSPDGRTIAYLTDEHGKQEMALLDLSTNKTRYIPLGDNPNYYFAPQWSPDSKKLAYTDYRHIIWIMDVAAGTNTKVDEGTYTDPLNTIEPRWSPDSKWLTWARDLESHMYAVFLYNLDDKKVTQVTDGLANAKGPVFDKEGKHLYFYASTNTGQSASWLDLSSFNQPNVTSSVYAIVLSKDGPNPLQPESDEEPIKEEPKTDAPAPGGPGATPPIMPGGNQPPAGAQAGAGAPPQGNPQGPGGPGGPGGPRPPAGPKPTKIDLENIEHRIIALPFPERNYVGLYTSANGNIFAYYSPPKPLATDFGGPGTILRFNFNERQVAPFAEGVFSAQMSADGTKLLVQRGPRFFILSAMQPTPPGAGGVDFTGLMAKVDPKAEWERMFHLIWRNEKMLFYDPNLHGINADEMDRRYSPFLKNIASRSDLNYLFTDMLGEISIGHMFISGGDIPGVDFVPGGLLGADYTFENGRYKLARIYDGERWNPELRSPLAQPGVNAKVGEYILAIDGVEINDVADIYERLEGKAGRQVKVKIGPNADGTGSREVTVVPVADETDLRFRAWVEDNRRRVSEATGGKVGYVHVPNTAESGWTEFIRYYYSQVGKQGVIVDERFNGGGLINDFMIDVMSRELDAVFTPRNGKDWPTPGGAIYGPKVMIVNEMAGSGGDMFPWLFKHRKLGPVVGKRTWGGLVAAFGFSLPDGGAIRAPDDAFYNPHEGKWDVEGHGVDPTIEVEFDPYLWRQGKDAQLERSIAEVERLMKTYKYPKYQRPPYPDRSKVDVRY